jgi:cobalamin biosynthesis Mg chelatase CobN
VDFCHHSRCVITYDVSCTSLSAQGGFFNLRRQSTRALSIDPVPVPTTSGVRLRVVLAGVRVKLSMSRNDSIEVCNDAQRNATLVVTQRGQSSDVHASMCATFDATRTTLEVMLPQTTTIATSSSGIATTSSHDTSAPTTVSGDTLPPTPPSTASRTSASISAPVTNASSSGGVTVSMPIVYVFGSLFVIVLIAAIVFAVLFCRGRGGSDGRKFETI